jgi:hypothetical protein
MQWDNSIVYSQSNKDKHSAVWKLLEELAADYLAAPYSDIRADTAYAAIVGAMEGLAQEMFYATETPPGRWNREYLEDPTKRHRHNSDSDPFWRNQP